MGRPVHGTEVRPEGEETVTSSVSGWCEGLVSSVGSEYYRIWGVWSMAGWWVPI